MKIIWWARVTFFRLIERSFCERPSHKVHVHICIGGDERPGVMGRSLYRRVGCYFYEQLSTL